MDTTSVGARPGAEIEQLATCAEAVQAALQRLADQHEPAAAAVRALLPYTPTSFRSPLAKMGNLQEVIDNFGAWAASLRELANEVDTRLLAAAEAMREHQRAVTARYADAPDIDVAGEIRGGLGGVVGDFAASGSAVTDKLADLLHLIGTKTNPGEPIHQLADELAVAYLAARANDDERQH